MAVKPRTGQPLRAVLAVLLATPLLALAAELPVVGTLDLDRYLGKWHEIARYPNSFERKCTAGVTAFYTRRGDDTISVVNECRKGDGAFERAEGVGRVISPARLTVRFAPDWLSWLPLVWGDYWVIMLAPDYSYAVVGEPDREYLWIMSRAPSMDHVTWQTVTAALPALGYDAERLVRNPGTGP